MFQDALLIRPAFSLRPPRPLRFNLWLRLLLQGRQPGKTRGSQFSPVAAFGRGQRVSLLVTGLGELCGHFLDGSGADSDRKKLLVKQIRKNA